MSISKSIERSAADTTGAVTPRPKVFRPDVQGLRAFAVLAVVLYHAGLPVRGGFVGVDIFFVISGFVIGGLLLRELGTRGRVSFTKFYKRRARRLLPAAAVMIAITIGLSTILSSPLGEAQRAAGMAGSAASTFLANAYFYRYSGGYFQPASEANPFLHTWSLSVEEQFYFGFPIALLVCWWLTRKAHKRLLVPLCAAGLVLSLVLNLMYSHGTFVGGTSPLAELATTPANSLAFAFFSPFTRAWEFLAGVLVALVFARRRMPAAWGKISSWVGLGILIFSLFYISTDDVFPGSIALMPIAGAVLVLSAGSSPQRPLPTRLLSMKWPVRLGDLSYSWYLWHWPLIVFATLWFPDLWWVALAAAVVSLLPAVASFEWIEWPIHKGGRLRSAKATALIVTVGIALPFIAGRGLVYAWENDWWRTDVTNLQAEILPLHLDRERLCSSESPLGGPPNGDCSWKVPGATQTVLLIGDSNAGHLTEAMVAASEKVGVNLDVITSGGCPMVIARKYPTPGCQKWVEANLSSINSRRPPYSAVVVSNSMSYPFSVPERFSDDSLGSDVSQEDSLAGWSTGTAAVVKSIDRTSRVVLVEPIPHIGSSTFPACILPSILSSPDPGCGQMTAEEIVHSRDALTRSVRQAVGHDAVYFDTTTLICAPDRNCSAYLGNRLMYRDSAHLSVNGALRYTNLLTKTLRSVLAQPRSE